MSELHSCPAFLTFEPEVEALYQFQIRHGQFAINDMSLVIDLILEATAELPELAQALRGGLSGLLALSEEEQSVAVAPIIQYLMEPDVPSQLCESYFKKFTAKFYGSFIEKFNAPPTRSRKRVLFLAITPYFQILREAMFLRRLGYSPCLIFLQEIPHELRLLISDTFDLSVRIPAHLGFLGGMLDQLDVELMHIQTWMVNAGLPLPRYAIERKPQTASICEFYDILSIYAERDVFHDVWSDNPLTVDVDYGVEQFVCNHADAIIMRPNPEIVCKDMRQRWGTMPPAIQFWPYPVWEYATFNDNKYSKEDGIIRFVFAGSLRVGAPEISVTLHFISAIKKILNQGFAVDILHEPLTPVTTDLPHLRPYLDLMEKHPRFRIRDGVPPHLMSKEIARYDFGFSLFDVDFSTLKIKDIQLQTAIGTKMLSYLEAGLPVMMNSEFIDTSKFLTESGVGFTVKSSEIDQIASIVSHFDYPLAVRNIKRYFAEHCMEREISRLGDLYEQVLRKKGYRPPTTATLPQTKK